MANWKFQQSTGKLHFITDNGMVQLVGIGWAGQGDGKNNPAMQNVKGIGPLPVGWYTIGAPYESVHTGPYTLVLTPDTENTMFGRGDFRIHGASKTKPETSSQGCIIQTRPVREQIWANSVKRLQVVA